MSNAEKEKGGGSVDVSYAALRVGKLGGYRLLSGLLEVSARMRPGAISHSSISSASAAGKLWPGDIRDNEPAVV